MKKENVIKLLAFLPLFFAITGGAFMFLPVISINGVSSNIIDIINHASLMTALKALLFVLFGLNILAAIFIILKKPVFNSVAITLYILVLTTLILLPSIFTVADDTLVVNHQLGIVVNMISVSVSLIIALRAFFMTIKFTIKEMVELGVLVALAVVFDFIPKIRVGATGGSISLTMLPLFIIAFRFNFVKSFVASGIIYGLITCLFDGYGFATYPFDYLLGFGLISLTSLFRKISFHKGYPLYLQIIFFITAILVGGLSRFVGATLSSMVIYQTTLWGGLTYNATYILPSVGFSLVILLLFYGFLRSLNARFPIHD